VNVGLESRDHCQPDDSRVSNYQNDQHWDNDAGSHGGWRRRHDFRIEAQSTSRRGFSNMMLEPRAPKRGRLPVNLIPLENQGRG